MSLSDLLFGEEGLSIWDQERRQESIEEILDKLGAKIKENDYKFVVFDSLTAFADLVVPSLDSTERAWMRDIFNRLYIPEGLSIVISEWRPGATEGPEKYLADGVLRTYRGRSKDWIFVEIVCEKMRKTNVERGFRMLEFKDGEITLEFPSVYDIVPDMEPTIDDFTSYGEG